jgi:hypothetical protein
LTAPSAGSSLWIRFLALSIGVTVACGRWLDPGLGIRCPVDLDLLGARGGNGRRLPWPAPRRQAMASPRWWSLSSGGRCVVVARLCRRAVFVVVQAWCCRCRRGLCVAVAAGFVVVVVAGLVEATVAAGFAGGGVAGFATAPVWVRATGAGFGAACTTGAGFGVE